MAEAEGELTRLEGELVRVQVEIGACVAEYTGLTADEYYEQMGGEAKVWIDKPQLPGGMVDAADFLQQVNKLKREMRTRKADMEAKLKEMAGIDRALDLLDTPEGAALAGCSAVYGGRGLHDPVMVMQQKRNQLEGECRNLQFSTANLHEFVVRVKVMDGRGFQAALSALLQEQLKLMVAHKEGIAQRMVALRAPK